MILGDVFDHLEIGDGAISGNALGIALVVFGASGALAFSFDLGIGWAYGIAAVLGVLAYLVAVQAVRSLAASSDGEQASVVGAPGVTTAPTGPAGGEVALDAPGEIERRLAYADSPLDSGIRIRVVEHSGGRVKVAAAEG
ncbi:hypothetical protein GB864_04235 [Agromyces sp. MMS17-SY077]|uniref:NfeD-like C-terminal domain-containing protein n=2 Tax=Agromyces seonyuensis TaxID=2662446 RepID=A0A6I4NUJ8_9MICO|nr:hypothetical protein [Agromyces seonyuensis]MWB97761.1 hypothetical protein [Agromyces seonyuensis]